MKRKEYEDLLKDVLHIYNVSLKNNKGLETIKQLISSVCNLYDSLILGYLSLLKERGEIEDIPNAPLKRLEEFEKRLPEESIKKFLDEYKMLRRCLTSEIHISDEYRKSMKIICKYMDKEIVITQAKLKEIIESAKEFTNIMLKYIG